MDSLIKNSVKGMMQLPKYLQLQPITVKKTSQVICKFTSYTFLAQSIARKKKYLPSIDFFLHEGWTDPARFCRYSVSQCNAGGGGGGGVRTPHDIGAFKRVLQHQIRRLVVSSGGMDESGEVFFYEQYIFIHIVAQKMFLSSYFLVSI